MVFRRKRFFIIATCLIAAAIVTVLCVGLLANEKKTTYDGTLVWQSEIEQEG
ncbi:MAG: hypothetical protein GX059_06495 [Clostridiales bacterium]|jgi:hypothetical protein|nr:hypothetical protein [Clostridiales bacterium]